MINYVNLHLRMKLTLFTACCLGFLLLTPSCERYDELGEQFRDVYGTWELDRMSGGDLLFINPFLIASPLQNLKVKKLLAKENIFRNLQITRHILKINLC